MTKRIIHVQKITPKIYWPPNIVRMLNYGQLINSPVALTVHTYTKKKFIPSGRWARCKMVPCCGALHILY